MTLPPRPAAWRWSQGWARLSAWEKKFGVFAAVTGKALGNAKDPAVLDQRLRQAGWASAAWAGGQQVHENRVRWSPRSTAPREWPRTDGVLTDRPGVALRVLTADCVPVFLIHTRRPWVGLVHAGWRGVHKKILTRAVRALRQRTGLRTADLRVALGPHLKACCYEVENDVARFFRQTPGAVKKNPQRPGKYWLNLEKALRAEARALGIAGTTAAPWCTHCDRRFFSYRRDKTDQRQAAVLGWKGQHT